MLNLDSLAQLKELKQHIKTQKVLLEGTVRGSMGRYGFVGMDDGKSFFLAPDEMAKVLPGDRITFSETADDKGKPQAIVEGLLKSELVRFTGRFEKKGKAQFIEPDLSHLNHWIYLPPDACKGCNNHDWVSCEITRHPFPSGKPQAKVVKQLGKISDPSFERNYAIERFDLSHEWPETLSSELALLSDDRIPELAKDRENLTHLPFVTIDSEHTRDMDDALFAQATQNGWTLNVAIADPSAWFGMNTAIDQEAARRGNTLYFPGRSLPMLPPELAHGLCSLLENEERLALVCELSISKEGKVTGFTFKEALVKSHGKLNYSQVSQFLEGEKTSTPENLHKHVATLHETTQALSNYRQENHLVMDERPDFNFQLSEGGKIISIQRSDRNIAQKLVEEAMLATNVATAEYLDQIQTGIFISHPGIRPERVEDVKQILNEQNIAFEGSIDTPDGYKGMIKAIESSQEQTHPLKTIVSRMLTRSEFTAKKLPHVGMGFDGYTTFTSPIRKYNDLLVHRMIKAHLGSTSAISLESSTISNLQQNLSKGRAAVSLAENWLSAQFLADKAGQEFDVTITQSQPSGFTVQMVEWGIEGQVDLRKEKAKFGFNKLYLTHTSGDRKYQIGQSLKVKLEKVVLNQRQIQFTLIR